jgi:hypothetical protein
MDAVTEKYIDFSAWYGRRATISHESRGRVHQKKVSVSMLVSSNPAVLLIMAALTALLAKWSATAKGPV